MEELMKPDVLPNVIAGFVTFGLVIGAIVKGWRQGNNAVPVGPKSGETFELAGALIDGKDAKMLTHALDKNTAALNRCAAATEKSADRVEDASHEIGRLRDEIIRSQH